MTFCEPYESINPLAEIPKDEADQAVGLILCTGQASYPHRLPGIGKRLLELPHSEHETLVPAGLVFTGGSSNLSGIEALGREILRLPVRVGVPSNMHGITDTLRDPAHATSVGLLLWGAKNKGTRNWQSLGFGTVLNRLVSKISKLFR